MTLWNTTRWTLGIAVLAAALTLGFVAKAQEPGAETVDPARLAAAQEVLEIAGSLADMRKAMGVMKTAMIDQTRQTNPAMAEQLGVFLDELLAEGNPRVETYLTEAREALTVFYATRFTVEELNDLKTFYATPTGKKMLAITPEIPAAIAGPLVRFQQGLIQDLQAKMQKR